MLASKVVDLERQTEDLQNLQVSRHRVEPSSLSILPELASCDMEASWFQESMLGTGSEV